MDKRVILAVAGAGKTYTICNEIDENKKNLMIAYTNENIRNIKKELVKRFGYIPKLTSIMTFDSFVYRYMICPYEPTILKKFGKTEFIRKGITMKEPPQKNIKIKGKTYINSKYKKKDNLEHYNLSGYYYCSTLSELILKSDVGKNGIIKKISNRLNMFYDQIMIDEFQDFRKYDFDLIMKLVSRVNKILLVGDYYQHSVSGRNNSGKPFKKGKKDISYDEFVELLQKNKLKVDCVSLGTSRRCPKEICEFISKKLNIQIKFNNKNYGIIKFAKDDEIKDILEDDSIVKLLYQDAAKYEFNSINWSYSKGNTYESTCVILTQAFENIEIENFDISEISSIVINKLYVALSRTKGDLILIKKSQFDKLKRIYQVKNIEI